MLAASFPESNTQEENNKTTITAGDIAPKTSKSSSKGSKKQEQYSLISDIKSKLISTTEAVTAAPGQISHTIAAAASAAAAALTGNNSKQVSSLSLGEDLANGTGQYKTNNPYIQALSKKLRSQKKKLVKRKNEEIKIISRAINDRHDST